MATSYEDKIKEQAQPYLESGERVLAAFIGQPRGATTAKMGGVAPGVIGGTKTGKQERAAGEAGLELANPMALALTESRLVVLGVSPPIALGKGGDVKRLVSAALLTGVDSIVVKRLLVGKTVTVTVTVRGVTFKLEAGGGAARRGWRRNSRALRPSPDNERQSDDEGPRPLRGAATPRRGQNAVASVL
jgi:hypothetical protein